MRKAGLLVIVAGLLVGMALLIAVKSYRTELIHTVVVHGLEQKAPEGYSRERIRSVFDGYLETARKRGNEGEYVERLMALSHRLEKVQILEEYEVDQILEGFKQR
jgi:hypothetical protein